MIPHCLPWRARHEGRNIRQVLRTRQLVRGPWIDKVARRLEKRCGGHAAMVSSGTAGLHLAVLHSGIKQVVVPAFTYISTVLAVMMSGVRYLFRDIEEATWGVSGEDVLPAHLYGTLAHALGFIEDACEAFGAWKLRGLYGVLSFNQNKIVTGGGGGAVLCTYTEDAAAIQKTANQAYFMTNLQAAILDAQLDDFPFILKRKRQIAARYRRAFPEIQWLKSVTYWQPVGLLPKPAARVIEFCQSKGVYARPVWPCLPDLPMFSDWKNQPFPVARKVAKYGISLPCSPQLTIRQQDKVIHILKECLDGTA